ncbi:MAG TPA: NmrA family NAD(P)-binding protein [Chloroflexota bacterium]|jgi:uncharacterized protein YbjT (DUF2867 family)
MLERPILVTGAAGGSQGKTGRYVSDMLLARGVPVRAFVHTLDERSVQLRALGAEIVQGDFLDYPSVARAVQDVSAIYFAYPVQAGLLQATAIMADAARRSGVSRLVDMVMLQSSPDAPTPRMRENYLSEQIFEWADIGAAHVRATVFYENVRALVRPTLPMGKVQLPWGTDSTLVPLASAEDVARVAVGLLTSPSQESGSAVPVIGEILSLREIIDTLARVLDQPVEYQEISDGQWRDGALAAGYNQHAVDHLSQLWRTIRTSRQRLEVTETIVQLGGRRPKTFAEFVAEERETFLMPALSA